MVDRLEQLNIAPAFFGLVMDSLSTDIIISISRLFDTDTSAETVFEFLRFIESHLGIFTKEALSRRNDDLPFSWNSGRQITRTDITLHLKHLRACSKIIDHVRTRRNKRYAHLDKELAFDPVTLRRQAPLPYRDLQRLIKVTEQILNRYSIAFDGNEIDFRPINLFDVDKILDILHQYMEQFDRQERLDSTQVALPPATITLDPA
jgi:hypothetical protein